MGKIYLVLFVLRHLAMRAMTTAVSIRASPPRPTTSPTINEVVFELRVVSLIVVALVGRGGSAVTDEVDDDAVDAGDVDGIIELDVVSVKYLRTMQKFKQ